MSTNTPQETTRAPWLPMAAIALGQVIVSYNVAALPIVMGGRVESFGVPAAAFPASRLPDYRPGEIPEP